MRSCALSGVSQLGELAGADMSSPTQVAWTRVRSQHRQEWLCRRNCSLAPRQLASVFGCLAALALVIATAFALLGGWLVFPFACIEALALGAAFVVYARHAGDFERIVLSRDSLIVEAQRAQRVQRAQCSPRAARVEYSGGADELIKVIAAGTEIELGRYVPEKERARLAVELRSGLRECGH